MCATCADDGTCLSCTHPATARDDVCADATNCLVADAFDRCIICAAGFVLDDALACVAAGDNCAFLIDGVCYECFPGFVLEQGACVPAARQTPMRFQRRTSRCAIQSTVGCIRRTAGAFLTGPLHYRFVTKPPFFISAIYGFDTILPLLFAILLDF